MPTIATALKSSRTRYTTRCLPKWKLRNSFSGPLKFSEQPFGSFDTFLRSSFFRAFLTFFGRAFTSARAKPVNLSTNKSILPEGLLKRMQPALAEILFQTIGYSHNLVEQLSIHGYLERLQ